MSRLPETNNAPSNGDATARRTSREHDQSGSAWRRHLQFGWYALLFYLVAGAALEMFHGFKADFYLNAANETRRMLWTLAHAHGTLLALINIAFALTLRALSDFSPSARALASRCLIAATIVLPGGFFFGGLFIAGGDPGLPVLLVPLGALLLFTGVFIIARGTAGTVDQKVPAGTPRPDKRKRNRNKELTGV